jgi:hypothetical protein
LQLQSYKRGEELLLSITPARNGEKKTADDIRSYNGNSNTHTTRGYGREKVKKCFSLLLGDFPI